MEYEKKANDLKNEYEQEVRHLSAKVTILG